MDVEVTCDSSDVRDSAEKVCATPASLRTVAHGCRNPACHLNPTHIVLVCIPTMLPYGDHAQVPVIRRYT